MRLQEIEEGIKFDQYSWKEEDEELEEELEEDRENEEE